VFFLHDELIVHTPAALAPVVAEELRSAAADAGRMLFGTAPVEFALSVSIVDRYSDARS
jgi:DNA polymerase-1